MIDINFITVIQENTLYAIIFKSVLLLIYFAIIFITK